MPPETDRPWQQVLSTLPPIATATIGSYAAPGWYQTVLERGEYGERGISRRQPMTPRALALLDQDRAAIDVVSDGEVRRSDFSMGFYGRLQGLRAVPPRRRPGISLYDNTSST